MRASITRAIGLAIVASLSAACAGGGNTTESSALAAAKPAATGAARVLDHVAVGYFPVASDAPLFVAAERGYFKEQGIAAELAPNKGGSDAIPLLAQGQLDVNYGDINAGTFAAIDRGIAIKIVAPGSRSPRQDELSYANFIVRKNAFDAGQIRTISDLKGATISYNAPGGLAEYYWAKMLQKYDLSLDDVHVQYLGIAETLVAMKNGAVDASYMQEPFNKQAIGQGIGVRLGTEQDQNPAPGLQSVLLIYSPKFIGERRDVGQRFLLAFEKAKRELEAGGLSRPETVQLVASYLKVDPATLKDTITSNYFDTSLKLDGKSLDDQQRLFIQRAELKLKQPLPAEQVIDTSFAQYALQQLGPPPAQAPKAPE